MEANKENFKHLTVKSKIPLPKAPLPALPNRLLTEHNKKDDHEKIRQPLKTLNTQSENCCNNQAGPSKIQNGKRRRSLIIDTRHVTVRNKELSPEYGTKHKENASIISISDEDDDDHLVIDEHVSKTNILLMKRQNSCLGEHKQLTPAKSPNLENKRVKNIKQSLKRPHSRELQRISPLAGPDRDLSYINNIKKRLDFTNSLINIQPPDFWKTQYTVCLRRDYDQDIFTYLVNNERLPLDIPQIPSITRACVINWLLKLNLQDGNPGVIQSACWYMDSILGIAHVNIEHLQVVATACYWISHKLFNGSKLTAVKLSNCAKSAFSPRMLLSTERTILRKLNFPCQPVVPQEFISYISWWCDETSHSEIEVAATFLCLSGLMVDRSSCTVFPSAMASASVRNALLMLKKENLLVQLQICPVFKLATKKSPRLLSRICSVQRKAVRMLSMPTYEYKALVEIFGQPPHFIAQRIISSAKDML